MRDFFKRIRFEVYLTALLTVAMGVVLIVWPLEVTGLICRIIGVLLIIMGAANLFSYFVDKKGMLTVTGGLIFLLLGVWIFVRPGAIAQLVPIVIGVVLLVHSLKDFQMAAEARRNQSSKWGILFLLALLNCAFGIVCICDSFGVLPVAVRMIGVALVYDGISSACIVFFTVQSVKEAAEKLAPIDVEAHEVDD